MEKLTNSPRINKSLKKMHIFSLYDLIHHVPRKYEDFSLTNDRNLTDKERVVFSGELLTDVTLKNTRKIKILTFEVISTTNTFHRVVCFNRVYLASMLKKGDKVTIIGNYNKKDDCISMLSIHKGEFKSEKIKPIYSLHKDLQNYEYARLVKSAFENLKGKINSIIPYKYINKYRLANKEVSLHAIHFPKSMNEVKAGYRIVKYEEALMFSLKNQLIRENNRSYTKAKKEPIGIESVQDFIKALPFELTNDQLLVSKEIIDDMNQMYLMYRLLQGDVGSGKTVVSFIALYANYLRGDQGALMAPTDALARQHYENAKKLFANFDVKIALLIGATPEKEKKIIRQDLEDGSIDIVIGTHALFSKNISYSNLGLAVIDEQHRFGVNQRAALLEKGKHIDLLMMSATPIPRSLALTIFGDLDVSTITQFPTKDKKIVTKVIDEEDEIIDSCIQSSLKEHRPIYVVAPLIEGKSEKASVEKLFENYQAKYGDNVGLLHGKLPQNQKEEVLSKFINGEVPILVTTQVIEVGIDVPRSNLMVIYSADNFGLASLHQLRGRIGRDGSKSTCLLVSEGNERLHILEDTLDGFAISEEDMKNRGPGELSGLKQSGLPEFEFLNVVNDLKIFMAARDDAKEIIQNPHEKGNEYIINKAQRDLEKGFNTNA